MNEEMATRCDALKADEDFILSALTDAYQRGEIPYLYYSSAFDVTAARAAALSWQAAAFRRDTDGSPEGPDPQGLDGEAATAGAAESGIAQTSLGDPT
jgi:hypothetical protein